MYFLMIYFLLIILISYFIIIEQIKWYIVFNYIIDIEVGGLLNWWTGWLGYDHKTIKANSMNII